MPILMRFFHLIAFAFTKSECFGTDCAVYFSAAGVQDYKYKNFALKISEKDDATTTIKSLSIMPSLQSS